MKKAAFTLIELLVVIVIIGILATLTTATFSGSREKADEAKVLAERSDACKEALAACTSLGASGCETFDECMADPVVAPPGTLFTITDNEADPSFSSYGGYWYDSGELTQYDTVVHTNGIAGAVAYISPMEFPIDPINYAFAPSSTLFFNTFEDAKAYDAYASDYNFYSSNHSNDIAEIVQNGGDYSVVGFMNTSP